jgi:two-component system sensor histidine kinase GlrK
MKITIFSRLVLGFLLIFLVVMGINIYTLVQLHRLTTLTDSALRTDDRLLEYENKLRESFLSQVRYEKKYLITKDPVFHQQFASFKKDFLQQLKEAVTVADARMSAVLETLRKQYRLYNSRVEEEMKGGTISSGSSPQRSAVQINRVTDTILAELGKIKLHSQSSIREKMEILSQATTSAKQVTAIVGVLCLVFIIGISFFITRGIIQPLFMVKKKTEEIGRGQLEGNLNLSSPPEISELASAINMMCEKLKEVDRMKSDFFTLMAHELRTPLASIKEGINLLSEGAGGPVSTKQERILSILRKEGLRLIDLVNSLLDFSKMDAGMMTYSFRPDEVPPLLRLVMTEILPLAEARKIRLEENISLTEIGIKMDRERILQVLRNLVGNAVKFTPEGGRVMISARHSDHGVEVSVTDTGPGIPQESIATIFDKFRQSSIDGQSQIEGTGLGLAIARHIITAHGGRIWAESNPKCGSTFTFVLPS